MDESLNARLADLPDEPDEPVIKPPEADLDMEILAEPVAAFDFKASNVMFDESTKAAVEAEDRIEQIMTMMADIRATGGMTRTLAIEAYPLLLDTVEKPHLNSFSTHPTRTNLQFSLEALLDSSKAAIAAIIAAILALIAGTYVWLSKRLGGGSSKATGATVATAARDAVKDARDLNHELAGARHDLSAVEKDLRSAPLTADERSNLGFVDQFALKSRAEGLYRGLMADGLFQDIVLDGVFTKRLVALANNTTQLILPQYTSFLNELDAVLRLELKGEDVTQRSGALNRMRAQMQWGLDGSASGKSDMAAIRQATLAGLDQARSTRVRMVFTLERSLEGLVERTRPGNVLSTLYENVANIATLLDRMEGQLSNLETLYSSQLASGRDDLGEGVKRAAVYLRYVRQDVDDLKFLSVAMTAHADAIKRYVAQTSNVIVAAYAAIRAALKESEIKEKLDERQRKRLEETVATSAVNIAKLRRYGKMR